MDYGENCRLLPVVKNQEILAKYYSLGDAFVICSKKENFPTTCLEAQCCGTPVAGFDTDIDSLKVAKEDGTIPACSGWTQIFIYPGYEFHGIDALLTNFHLPKSTLIMLISALAGKENVLNAYKHAVKEKYRFFSFGDCMFIK